MLSRMPGGTLFLPRPGFNRIRRYGLGLFILWASLDPGFAFSSEFRADRSAPTPIQGCLVHRCRSPVDGRKVSGLQIVACGDIRGFYHRKPHPAPFPWILGKQAGRSFDLKTMRKKGLKTGSGCSFHIQGFFPITPIASIPGAEWRHFLRISGF